MENWISVAISAAMSMGTLCGTLLMIGRFIGRSTEAMAHLTSSLVKLDERVGAVEAGTDDGALWRAGVEVRIQHAESAAKALWSVKDEVIAMRAASEVRDQYSREKLETVGRSIAGIERQMASLVAEGRTGLRPLMTDQSL